MIEDIKFTFKAKGLSVETRAQLLEVSVGEYLDYLWHLNLMPVYTETEQMTELINKAVLGTGKMSSTLRQRLVEYRMDRKEKFFEDSRDLEVVYELYKAGLSDLDISVITDIEQYHIFTITGLFRDPRVELRR